MINDRDHDQNKKMHPICFLVTLMTQVWESVVFSRQFSYFSAISWREQVKFVNEMMMRSFVPDQHAKLDLYSASLLKQQSVDRHVAPLGHISLIPSQPVFVLTLLMLCA